MGRRALRTGHRPALSRTFRGFGIGALALAALIGGSRGTQDAVANGDTRTLPILHTHTKESASITFRRNGRYDPQALEQLNWILRDWRLDEPTKMDPRLFDVVWEVYRSVGASEPVHVVSAYRSSQTNSMLRRRSRGVAKHSQHTAGKAMDFYLPDADMARVRAVAMRLQQGGVGYYPSAGNPFVHLDAGSVRAWPRMTRDQLARLFPDGRTVHVPADGTPLPGYEEAKAEIIARGGSVLGYASLEDEDGASGSGRGFWASLFGGGPDEDAAHRGAKVQAARGRAAGRTQTAALDAASSHSEDGGSRGFFAYAGQEPAPAAFPIPSSGRSRRGETEPLDASQAAGLAAAPSGPAPRLEWRQGSEPEESGTGQIAAVPMPPRRPDDIASLAALAAPMPPARPIEIAAIGPVAVPAVSPARAGADVGPDKDDRAALRALFVAVATSTTPPAAARVATSRAKPQPDAPAGAVSHAGSGLAMTFSSKAASELSVSRFSGPAVKPLPVLR